MTVIGGTQKALNEGFLSYEDRLRKLNMFGIVWRGEFCEEPTVTARVDFGRLIADCECGGAEYVTPKYPWFFCFSCGNAMTGGRARPVIFPGGE
jgi:hypothetical protein